MLLRVAAQKFSFVFEQRLVTAESEAQVGFVIPYGHLTKPPIPQQHKLERWLQAAARLDMQKLFLMNTRKNFNSSRVPRMSDAFPQAVIADKLIFISGTPGIDHATGRIISSDFEQQVRQSFYNIKTILEDAGSDISKVIKTTIFMVAGNDFTVINKVYIEFFPDNAPARSTPQVMPFPGGILVSVECIAQA